MVCALIGYTMRLCSRYHLFLKQESILRHQRKCVASIVHIGYRLVSYPLLVFSPVDTILFCLCEYSPIWELMAMSRDIEGDYKKALERRARDNLAYQRSIITDSFQGILISTVTCPCCAFKEQSLDPFFSMRYVLPMTL